MICYIKGGQCASSTLELLRTSSNFTTLWGWSKTSQTIDHITSEQEAHLCPMGGCFWSILICSTFFSILVKGASATWRWGLLRIFDGVGFSSGAGWSCGPHPSGGYHSPTIDDVFSFLPVLYFFTCFIFLLFFVVYFCSQKQHLMICHLSWPLWWSQPGSRRLLETTTCFRCLSGWLACLCPFAWLFIHLYVYIFNCLIKF